jgi:aspartate ammonia-lyase
MLLQVAPWTRTLDQDKGAAAIVQACADIRGALHEQFVVDVIQDATATRLSAGPPTTITGGTA